MNRLHPHPPDDRTRVVAFGGGKGGAGRSTLCAEIARSAARSGYTVLCVDSSWECATLNTLLHAEEPEPWSVDASPAPLGAEGSHVADYIMETAHRNVWLMSLASARVSPYVRARLTADWIIDQFHELNFDFIFLDLPPGSDPLSVGLFLQSDIPVLVATPEPASLRMASHFMSTTLYHAVGLHPDAWEHQDEIIDLLRDQSAYLGRDSLLRRAISSESRRIITEITDRYEPYVIINMVREGAERDLGYVLAHALFRELGVFPRFLASVDYEDRRWFFNRRTLGTSAVRGEEALSQDIETIARFFGDLSLIDQKFPRPVPRGPEAHPALKIGLNPETGRNEVRQHCRRLWEGYRRETSLSLVFADSERRTEIAEELEHIYRKVLTLPSDSFVVGAVPTHPTPEPVKPSVAREPTPHPKPKLNDEARTVTTSDDSNERRQQSPGKIVERLRKQRRMSLQDLSLRSHIGLKYLTAIEEADPQYLPRPVYLRGYLREIARVFEVDADELIDQYFRFLGPE